mmetsp:Transcript_4423/g.9564  ORF Transcript_4423/g.9564 Transcript_4423/m.9564 type:complete len:300 (+) Transcript_4423:426-1325(+)
MIPSSAAARDHRIQTFRAQTSGAVSSNLAEHLNHVDPLADPTTLAAVRERRSSPLHIMVAPTAVHNESRSSCISLCALETLKSPDRSVSPRLNPRGAKDGGGYLDLLDIPAILVVATDIDLLLSCKCFALGRRLGRPITIVAGPELSGREDETWPRALESRRRREARRRRRGAHSPRSFFGKRASFPTKLLLRIESGHRVCLLALTLVARSRPRDLCLDVLCLHRALDTQHLTERVLVAVVDLKLVPRGPVRLVGRGVHLLPPEHVDGPRPVHLSQLALQVGVPKTHLGNQRGRKTVNG